MKRALSALRIGVGVGETLDRERFHKFLKRGGHSLRVVGSAVKRVDEFEHYLREERGGRELDVANPEDLEAFTAWIEEGDAGAAKKYLLGIRYYYEHISNETLSNLASFKWNERMSNLASVKLKEFRGVNREYVEKLGIVGIRSVDQMLSAGRTRTGRKELSARAGVPVESVLELVKLSDLARIQGVKGIRARLYYDAGVDTVKKLAEWNPEKLRTMLIRFIEKTGFDGTAPLPKEANNTVEMAKRLPKIVEY